MRCFFDLKRGAIAIGTSMVYIGLTQGCGVDLDRTKQVTLFSACVFAQILASIFRFSSTRTERALDIAQGDVGSTVPKAVR